MSVETATNVVSETISSSVEAVGFSNIAPPIITEIPKPAGMELLDSPPAPLTGDFDIKDIIAQPFKESVNQTRIEPAVFMSPKIVEEIYAPKNLIVENAQEPTAPIDSALISDWKSEVFSQEPEPEHKQVEQTPAITAEILTLIPIETTQEEAKANQRALADAQTLLHSQEFTDQEVQYWETILARAAAVEIKKGSVNTDENETDLEIPVSSPAVAGDGNPPKTEVATEIAPDNEQPPKTEQEQIWDVYFIDKRWKIAKDTNEARQKVANEIAMEAALTDDNPRLAVEESLYKLDVPSLEDTVKIATGDLDRPPVAHKLYTALTFVDDTDVRDVQYTVLKTVANSSSLEKKRQVEKIKVEPKDLPKEAQRLIADGAEHLIYKNGQWWKPVKKLNIKEPVETEKAA